MNTDFRLSANVFENKKIIRLIRKLGPQGFVSWIALIAATTKERPSGNLINMSHEDIAIDAKWPDQADLFVDTLVELRLLDKIDNGYALHDWVEHNRYAASHPLRQWHSRLANHEKRLKRNGMLCKAPQCEFCGLPRDPVTGKIVETSEAVTGSERKTRNPVTPSSNPNTNTSSISSSNAPPNGEEEAETGEEDRGNRPVDPDTLTHDDYLNLKLSIARFNTRMQQFGGTSNPQYLAGFKRAARGMTPDEWELIASQFEPESTAQSP